MGRAPTSGNCHTCRQRRVKCDKARPACARCVRGGFVCQGYETVLRMQNHAVVAGAAPGSVRLAKVQNVSSYPKAASAEAPAKTTPPAVTASTASTTSTASTVPNRSRIRWRQSETSRALKTPPALAAPTQTPPTAASSSPLSSTHRSIHDASSDSSASPPLLDHATAYPSIPPELSFVGFVDDMAFSYFFQAYGWINMHSLLLQDSAMRSHLLPSSSSFSSSSSPNGMAQDSLRALCYGLLGRDKHIPALQHAGRRVYGKAIGNLQSALMTPSRDRLAALVKPISLLGAYAVTVDHDRRFTHHAGLARILDMCGPAQFQSPELLPVFEAARMTLLADSFVRRPPASALTTSTAFLDSPDWKTVPWARDPAAKSATHRLLDVLSAIPAIIQGIWGVFHDRVAWLAADQQVPRIEEPDAVANLQARVAAVRAGAAAWRQQWVAASPACARDDSDIDGGIQSGKLAEHVLAWAYAQAGDNVYRPGLDGVQGPDLFRTSLDSILSSWNGPASPPLSPLTLPADALATHLQDAALYTTVLVWTDRLDRYLGRAAHAPTCVDFFSTPFRTRCRCRDTIPPTQCTTIPPMAWDMRDTTKEMAWNVATCTMTGGPVRCVSALRPELTWPSPVSAETGSPSMFTSASASASSHPSPTPLAAMDSAPAAATNLLLPGDIRFVAHMRILAWLCARLPATRGHVLATLSAIGLAHCAHDVRPAEGHADIAAVAVARAFDSTGIDGASDILLRTYAPAVEV
ncbi:hypothetical protein SCUCBS95973_004710 [Sporothrix curviconia]|uniref:Zn(2)-C6 fungal-type domain-containing protein n=1 Tax=Sporothrix curviconia TaxID=1260050 RepID=A0ABP0BQV7_9PEZI